MAVIFTLVGFGGTVTAMFLLVLGSIESFKEDGLGLYVTQAAVVSNITMAWLSNGWGIEVRARVRACVLACLHGLPCRAVSCRA